MTKNARILRVMMTNLMKPFVQYASWDLVLSIRLEISSVGIFSTQDASTNG
jgi:hypothetical protein